MDNDSKDNDLEQMAEYLKELVGKHCPHYGAVAVAKMAHELHRRGDHKAVERMLLLTWIQISEHLTRDEEAMKGTPPPAIVAAMFLDLYFKLRGDWNKIDTMVSGLFEKDHGAESLRGMDEAVKAATDAAMSQRRGMLN
jgi:hypothetical protein